MGITIVIPAHNDEATLRETLESVARQSSPDFGCIVVDDASIDGSLAIVRDVVAADGRFAYLQTHGGGAQKARNMGLRHAADHVLFLDADDVLHPDCIAIRSEAIAANPGAQMLVSHTLSFDGKPGDGEGGFFCSGGANTELIADFVAHRIRWTTTGVTWKKQFLTSIGGWNENYPRLQDVELSIRALMAATDIAFIGKADSYRRRSAVTPEKTAAARVGFDLLIRNYYLVLDAPEIRRAFRGILHMATPYTWDYLRSARRPFSSLAD